MFSGDVTERDLETLIAAILCDARSHGVTEAECDRAIIAAQQTMWEAGEMDNGALH